MYEFIQQNQGALMGLFFFLALASLAIAVFFAYMIRRTEKKADQRLKQARADITDMTILFQTMRDIIGQQKSLARDFNEELEHKMGQVKHILNQGMEKNKQLHDKQQRIAAELEEAQAQIDGIFRQITRLRDLPDSRPGTPRTAGHTPIAGLAARNNRPAHAAPERVAPASPAATDQPAPRPDHPEPAAYPSPAGPGGRSTNDRSVSQPDHPETPAKTPPPAPVRQTINDRPEHPAAPAYPPLTATAPDDRSTNERRVPQPERTEASTEPPPPAPDRRTASERPVYGDELGIRTTTPREEPGPTMHPASERPAAMDPRDVPVPARNQAIPPKPPGPDAPERDPATLSAREAARLAKTGVTKAPFSSWIAEDLLADEKDGPASPPPERRAPEAAESAPSNGDAAREAFRALLNMPSATERAREDPLDVLPGSAMASAPAEEHGPDGDPMAIPLQQRVLEYSEAGMTVAQVSRELGIGKGEVRLMLSLAKQQSPPGE